MKLPAMAPIRQIFHTSPLLDIPKEVAAEIAGHSSTRTTQLYDHSKNKMQLSEIEKIRI